MGSALVQLGKARGMKVVGVVGSSHKVQSVLDLGADAVIGLFDRAAIHTYIHLVLNIIIYISIWFRSHLIVILYICLVVRSTMIR